MLSKTSRQEILRKLSLSIGKSIDERDLSDETKQRITALSKVQNHLYMIDEILQGEKQRTEQNPLLRLSSRLAPDKEIRGHEEEILVLKAELDAKISAISKEVSDELDAARSGLYPTKGTRNVAPVELKCPSCSALLPMPSQRIVRCSYCNTLISLSEISDQMKDIIRST